MIDAATLARSAVGPETDRQTRVLHILPALGGAGAELMAASLMAGLAPAYQVAATGLYRGNGSVSEVALRRNGVPFWTLNKQAGPDPRMLARLNRVFRDFAPDVVHSHLYVLRYSLPVSLWRRTPVLLHTVHNIAERENDLAGRALQHLAFRRWVVPVAVSRNVASSMSRVYGIENAVTIPNGIPVRDFRMKPGARERWRKAQGLSDESILFIATGRLTKQKNPLLLLRAFAAVRNPQAHLILVGDGALREAMEREIRALGLAGRAHLLGRRTDVADCLAAGDVFVLSSDWEGNPLGVMEAMASGLPVVATSVGGVPELVDSGRHGILVEPGNAAALTAAMESLLGNPELRFAFGNASRERALREFSVESMVRAYGGLYASLLAKRARR